MAIKITPLAIAEVLLIEPEVFTDGRGHFVESYQRKKYEAGGVRAEFIQDNYSHSTRGVLRGLHYQWRHPQAKLVTCLGGEIFDVAVDLRRNSPTFGKWVGAALSGKTKRQLFIPEGFAHGFYVTSEAAQVHYKCSANYDPEDERGILWSDPQIAVAWPRGEAILSDKDLRNPPLRDAVVFEELFSGSRL